jgi:hypothetical protein
MPATIAAIGCRDQDLVATRSARYAPVQNRDQSDTVPIKSLECLCPAVENRDQSDTVPSQLWRPAEK